MFGECHKSVLTENMRWEGKFDIIKFWSENLKIFGLVLWIHS
jgi:hypothetical protein